MNYSGLPTLIPYLFFIFQFLQFYAQFVQFYAQTSFFLYITKLCITSGFNEGTACGELITPEV